MKKFSGALFFACLMAMPLAYGAKPGMREVQLSLKLEGEQKTLERYFSCEHFDDSAYPNIATGDRAWVNLAVRMLPHSDACYAEDILSALGKAMQKNPRNVLGYVNSSARLRADRICLPFISDEQPIRDQLEQLRAVKRAIAGVRSPALATQRKACLAEIQNLETSLTTKSAE